MMRPEGRGSVAGSGTAPRFGYYLETRGQPVRPEDPLWAAPLPLRRQAAAEPPVEGDSISVGDYFMAVQTFIESDGRPGLVRACAESGADASAASDVRIFLAKHGEYYHPARVEADVQGRPFRWVVNVAVSAAGRALLPREHALLERLRREFTAGYLPEVYAAGVVDAGRGRALPMFLARWLSGFHEFHLTRSPPDGRLGMLLWDPDGGHRRLDGARIAAVYYQAARILTHYLNLDTFEGIGAWHHAAGDFVVRLTEQDTDVRLISVRDYRPLFRASPPGADPPQAFATLLEMLLVFLLNLSIRMRLDRLDGTGELAWADPAAVAPTVAGMLDGLAGKPAPIELPLPIDQLFRRFLAACRAEDLPELCLAVAAKIDPAAGAGLPEFETRIQEHAATLADTFDRL
jgi:hypothetical protein